MAEATATTATTTATTATTAAATTGETTAATTTTAPAWHGVTDPEGAAYITNKGWQNPGDVIKSYQGAEKLIGRDPSTLLTMPRADDPAGFRAVMQKLGLPENPEKYDFGKPGPNDVQFDENYLSWAKQTFHKAGLPANVAKEIVAANQEYVKAQQAKMAEDYQVAVTADKAALQREWGGGHERMLNAAKTAATALGFTQPMIDAMEGQIGYAGTMKFFSQLGQKLGEDKFVSPNSGTGQRFSDTLTPAEANVQINAMKIDPVQSAALRDKQHPGHKDAVAKWQKLHTIANPS